MKKRTKGAGLAKKKDREANNHVFTAEDKAVIHEEIKLGDGRRSLFRKFVTERKQGEKNWSLGGLKKVVKSLGKGKFGRAAGSGRPRSSCSTKNVEAVEKHISDNPSSRKCSVRKVAKQFKIPKTSAPRIILRHLELKSIRRKQGTRLRGAQKEARRKFCSDYAKLVDSGKFDPRRCFWSDEILFTAGAPTNPQNDRIRTSCFKKAKDISADEAYARRAGKWGASRVTTSMAISSLGCATPYFVPKGTMITGKSHLEHLQQNLFPAMRFVAAKSGVARYSSQQDGASSHTAPQVLREIEKSVPVKFPFAWPPKSPDLAPCDFFLWGAMGKEMEEMAAPKGDGDLRANILLAAGRITPEMLRGATNQVYARRKMCLEQGGGRFEHMIG